jgi:hypothetical protein
MTQVLPGLPPFKQFKSFKPVSEVQRLERRKAVERSAPVKHFERIQKSTWILS